MNTQNQKPRRKRPSNDQRRLAARPRNMELYGRFVAGESQKALSEAYSITPQRVGQIIAKMDAEALEKMAAKRMLMKARQTRQQEHIYAEAMAAWERSKADAVTIQETTGEDGDKTTTTTKGQSGDPRFLDQANRALDSIGKLWGLHVVPARPLHHTDATQIENQTSFMQVIVNDPTAANAFYELASRFRGTNGEGGNPRELGHVREPRQVEASETPGATKPEIVRTRDPQD